MKNKIIEYAKIYKGFSIFLLIQFVFMIILIASSFRKVTRYELNSDNLVVTDKSVVTAEDGTFYVTGRNDEEPFARWLMTSDKIYLPYGVYELETNYNSLLYELENGGVSCSNATGIVQFVSENHSSDEFVYDEVAFKDDSIKNTGGIWVRSFMGIDDLEIKIEFNGRGDLHFKNLTIRELPAWRFVIVFVWFVLFALIDIMYFYFFMQNKYKDKLITAGLISVIFFSSLPLYTNFLFDGRHDLDFHMMRIWSLAHEIKNGHWIAPIQTEVLNRYGYAAPLFYGQLFLYLPAVLHCLAVPLQVCYQIYVFVVNVATCLISYNCIKGLFKDKYLALFGSFLYTLSAYRITNIYLRAAVGEYTAMVFLPLVLYGFAKMYMTDKKEEIRKEVFPIVAGLTGLIQSHLLSCEMCAIFIVILCIVCLKKTLQPYRFIKLAEAALLTVGVNLGFLLPLLQSMQMDTNLKLDIIDHIQGHGTYLMQVLGIFMTSGGKDIVGMGGEMPLTIGFSLVIGLTVFGGCCAEKHEWGLDNKLIKFGTVCSVFAMGSIIFSLRIFPWDSLYSINKEVAKFFCMVQFPWRYLSMATVFCLYASIVGIKLLGEHRSNWKNVVCGSMAICTLVIVGDFYMNFANGTGTVISCMNTDLTAIGLGEYLHLNTIYNDESDYDLFSRRIITDESCVTVTDYDYTDGVTTFWCSNASDDEKTVEIPLLNYDNYHAYALNGGEELSISNGWNNYVNVVVKPHYEGMIKVQYEIPALWKVSYIISVFVALSMIASVIYGKRKGAGRVNLRRE